MNLKKILYGATILGLCAACSDDTPRPGDNSVSQSRPDGYMTVQVNLPQAQGTRADNDKFLDGDENEYTVTDGCILIFAGKDEATATLRGAFSLNQGDKYDSLLPDEENKTNDNITTSYQKIVEVSNIKRTEEEPNLYGLVMLNYAGVGEIAADHKFVLRSNGQTVETLEDLTTGTTDYLTNFIGSKKNYFFMANAPVYTKAGGPIEPTGGEFITLIELNADNIYETETLAKNGEVVGEFFVERAVAKTTLSVKENLENVEMATPTIAGKVSSKVLKIGDVEWALGNQENVSYLVRNTKDHDWYNYTSPYATDRNNKYRFVSGAVMGKTQITNYETVEKTPVFRTYWGTDPNYGSDKDACDDVNNAVFAAAGGDAVYSFENTFDVDHQNHFNTTRAIVKVQLNEGETFYTVNGRQDVLYAADTDAMAYAKNYVYQSRAVYTAVKTALDEALGTEANATQSDVTAVLDEVQNYITVEFGEYDVVDGKNVYRKNTDGSRVPTEEGYLTVKEIKFSEITANVNGKEIKFTPSFVNEEGKNEETTLVNAVNNLYKVAAYTNGVNYYDIWIKHFAGADAKDPTDLAPWDPEKLKIVSPTEDVEDAYGTISDSEQAFLGRYGMVRNNWYDIEISNITHFGKPGLTNLTVGGDGTPDDEYDVEKWITFKVNVLAWALRQQSVTL